MNIFKILSQHDGSINEPNVSSFLAYLLDPKEDHGLSSLLLQSILEEYHKQDGNFFKELLYNKSIRDLSNHSEYSIEIRPELLVFTKQGKRRDIDILIEIKDKDDKLINSICIENKIKSESINKRDNQLEEELDGLKQYYSERGIDVNSKMLFIYLTPRIDEKATEAYSKLEFSNKMHLAWDKNDVSIFNMINDVFSKESRGKIDPINNQASYLIKSFQSFIRTGFVSYVQEKKAKAEKKTYGKPIIEHISEFLSKYSYDEEIQLRKLKEDFSKYILEKTNTPIIPGTLYAQFNISIVNERNRGHFNVVSFDDSQKNLLYYPNKESKEYVKRFKNGIDENVKIYYRSDNEITSVFLKDIL